MFRKLTTIIDSKLAREIEQGYESELCASEGFKVCMGLGFQIVYPGLNHTLKRKVRIGREFDEQKLSASNNETILAQFMTSSEGYRLRELIEETHRLEVVISHFSETNQFDWLLLLFKKSKKEFYLSVTVHVTLDGKISRPYMMSGY